MEISLIKGWNLKNNQMNILVNEINELNKDNETIKESEDIICPNCDKNSKIKY